MAEIIPRVIDEFNNGVIAGVVVHWDNITENDAPASYECAGWADISVQISGTAGGSTYAIQGANHPGTARVQGKTPAVPGDSVFANLNDSTGTALTGKSTGFFQVLEHTYHIKPVRTGGTGTDIDITMILYNPVK